MISVITPLGERDSSKARVVRYACYVAGLLVSGALVGAAAATLGALTLGRVAIPLNWLIALFMVALVFHELEISRDTA